MTRPTVTWILSIATIINSVLMLGSYVLIIFSIFTFDNVSGDGGWANYLMLYSAMGLPILALLAIILSWVYYKRQRYTLAWKVCLLPLISIVLFLLGSLIWFS